MKRNLPPYVYPITSRGKLRHYFRRSSINVRVDPGAPDFWAKYARLLEAKPIQAIRSKTWIALIARYRRSALYEGKSPRTKADYEPILKFIESRYGEMDPRQIRKVDIVMQQEALSGKFARDFVNVISVLLNLSTEIGWREDNPARGVRRKQTERKAPHIVWTDGAVAKFRAEASPFPLLIFELGIGTIQRPDDWTRFNWEDFDGTAIRVVQGKTGNRLTIPCPQRLVDILEAARPRIRNIAGTPMLQIRGRRITYRRMAEIMLAERQRLGLARHDLHALRYRGVQELAWAGCTDEEIMAITGHSTESMVRKYAGEARQITRARQANEKRKGA